MRREDINELLDESNELLEQVIALKTVPRPKVKSIFEHLRSSLEYLAQDINENLIKPNKKIYFPYGRTEVDFDNSIRKNMRQLPLELPEIHREIYDIQGFKSGDDWLTKLCDLTNDAKHNNAIDVKHSEDQKTINVYAGGFGLIQIVGNSSGRVMNNRVDGKSVDDFICDNGEVEVTKKGELPLDFEITNDKKILIGDELLDLVPFLNKCIENITAFIDKIYVLLETHYKRD